MKIKLDEGAYMPTRAHGTDAGYDLRSPVCAMVHPRDSVVVDTGVHIELPPGKCALLVSKSGLCIGRDIVTTGLIDEGFTGTIKVKLMNHGPHPYSILRGDKVSQFVILDYHVEPLELVEALPETERGNGGYGSTGR